MDHLERITLEPEKRAGKPCIRGLRITVYDVLEYLASGMTEAEILADFPDLEPEDIRASLPFAKQSLGVGVRPSNGLGRLAGQWSDELAREFEDVLAPFGDVDPEI